MNFLIQIGKAPLFDWLQDHNWLQIQSDFFDPLKAYVQEVLYLVINQPSFFESGDRQRSIVNNLLPLLVECLTGATSRLRPFEGQTSRISLVKQAEQLIEENLDQPITLTDIYSELHTSRRTLIYTFKDVVGMTPMAYVKLLRLNAVRRQLLMADPEIVSVYPIAHQYGFWSAGHFARDYRSLFGESPSQTLQAS